MDAGRYAGAGALNAAPDVLTAQVGWRIWELDHRLLQAAEALRWQVTRTLAEGLDAHIDALLAETQRVASKALRAEPVRARLEFLSWAGYVLDCGLMLAALAAILLTAVVTQRGTPPFADVVPSWAAPAAWVSSW